MTVYNIAFHSSSRNVLKNGFVKLIDCMPRQIPIDARKLMCDSAVVQAARVSYGQGLKSLKILIPNIFPFSRADVSRASISSMVSFSPAVFRFRVTCRANDPENPVLPSVTISQTGSNSSRPCHENCHIARSEFPASATRR